MDQALIGAGVGATIQVALQNVLRGPIDQIIQVCGVDEDMENLKNSLLMIQDFVSDAEMKQVNSRAVRRWLEQLEDVAFDVDAVLDEFNYELLRQKVEDQNRAQNDQVTTFLITSGPSTLLFRNQMANKIKNLNKRLKAINKDARNYGLQMAVIGASHTSSVGSPIELRTNSFYVEPNIIGRENDVSEIVNMLVMASPQETFSVIPIVGMAGIGKTTLARSVFHHERIGAHFSAKIWVCVSFHFDAMALYKMILEKLTRESAQAISSEEVVLEKIQENLAGKKYLLVLDDVWNEDFNTWDAFMSSLSGTCSLKGNCILVTTRSENVASNVGTLTAFPLRKLSEDECWSIIKAKASLRVELPAEFEIIGKCIAQRCGGLPLAAKLIAGLLRGKSKDEWTMILENQLSNFGQNDDTIMKILMLSYDRLPSSSHKKCFAYCSIFPRDFTIKRVLLIDLWMAEGFLQADRKMDMEAVGDEIFYHLLQHSLLQDAWTDIYGKVTNCKMHDLVHDLACSVSGSRTINMKNDTFNGVHLPRYLAMDSVKEESYAILNEQAMYLRTIFFEGKIMNMIAGFTRLHVLKLMDESIKELPEVIGDLIHLRFLDISGTKITYLPDSIGRLYNLQTLCISSYRTVTLKNLPNTIVDLISLRHLQIYGAELPPWMGRLTSLQTLPYYTVGHEQGCKIEELGNLKNLKGLLVIQNLERVKRKEEARCADLLRKPNITGLIFEWNQSGEGKINYQNVLDGLQPHPNLKSLKIRGYADKNSPPWTMKMMAHNDIEGHGKIFCNLIKMQLENCSQCEVPMFGHLPHLRLLELNDLPNVQSIGLSFYGLENHGTLTMIGNVNLQEPKITFPALEELKLWKMPELTEWADVGGALTVFPCLKFLEIKRCPKLKSLPSRFPCLERLRIQWCPKLKSVPGYFPCLQKLEVHEVDSEFSLVDVCSNTSYFQSISIKSLPGLIYLPEEFFAKNRSLTRLRIERCQMFKALVSRSLGGGASLKKLDIRDCKDLKEVELGSLHSLEELYVHGCPVQSIPSVEGLTSLRIWNISSCENLQELPPDLNNLLSLELLYISRCSIQSIPSVRGLSSLRLLKISSCENLSELPPDLNTLHSLDTLDICSCPELERIPSIEGLTSLRKLMIWMCEKLREPPLGVNTLHSLDKFYISCCPEVQSIPSVNGLTSLRKLKIRCENLRELPLGLNTLNSLEVLKISNCQEVKSIPQGLTSLTSLQQIRIEDCPGLTDLPSGLLQSCASSLKHLSLRKLENLKSLGEVIPSLSGMSSLQTLTLQHIPHLTIFPTEICYLRSLLSLNIGGFSDSIHSVSFKIHLNSLFSALRSLERLSLTGKEDWDTLPDQIQHLSALTDVRLYDSGIEALPEWIGKLSCLVRLDITKCKRLRYLPSKKAMLNLTKLDEIYITGCPLMPPNDDCMWSNISHIRSVMIDGRRLPTRNYISFSLSQVIF